MVQILNFRLKHDLSDSIIGKIGIFGNFPHTLDDTEYGSNTGLRPVLSPYYIEIYFYEMETYKMNPLSTIPLMMDMMFTNQIDIGYNIQH